MPNPAAGPHAARLRLALACVACVACAPKPLPDPRAAAERWAKAAQSRDVDATYALLTESSRRTLGREGVARLLRENHKEAVDRARAAAASNGWLETTVQVSYADDRRARVVLEGGHFRVAAAGALPAAATSPTDALRELREVLARRSFDGLLRVLTRGTADNLEGSLRDLVDALEEPSALDLEVEGRRALARLPGGHTVTLEREDGVWRVKDFD